MADTQQVGSAAITASPCGTYSTCADSCEVQEIGGGDNGGFGDGDLGDPNGHASDRSAQRLRYMSRGDVLMKLFVHLFLVFALLDNISK